jgi:hypothetical protein
VRLFLSRDDIAAVRQTLQRQTVPVVQSLDYTSWYKVASELEMLVLCIGSKKYCSNPAANGVLSKTAPACIARYRYSDQIPIATDTVIVSTNV